MSLKIEQRKTEALKPYARNARTHDEAQIAQIAASITEFGFNNPVLIAADGEIIAGHGRVLAAAKLGLDKVPVIVLGHLTDAQRRAYVLADNKLALNSGWDERLLAEELAALEEIEFNLDLTGFSLDEVDLLLAEPAGPAEKTAPDSFPSFDESIPVEHACPKCGYAWSGKS